MIIKHKDISDLEKSDNQQTEREHKPLLAMNQRQTYINIILEISPRYQDPHHSKCDHLFLVRSPTSSRNFMSILTLHKFNLLTAERTKRVRNITAWT